MNPGALFSRTVLAVQSSDNREIPSSPSWGSMACTSGIAGSSIRSRHSRAVALVLGGCMAEDVERAVLLAGFGPGLGEARACETGLPAFFLTSTLSTSAAISFSSVNTCRVSSSRVSPLSIRARWDDSQSDKLLKTLHRSLG